MEEEPPKKQAAPKKEEPKKEEVPKKEAAQKKEELKKEPVIKKEELKKETAPKKEAPKKPEPKKEQLPKIESPKKIEQSKKAELTKPELDDIKEEPIQIKPIPTNLEGQLAKEGGKDIVEDEPENKQVTQAPQSKIKIFGSINKNKTKSKEVKAVEKMLQDNKDVFDVKNLDVLKEAIQSLTKSTNPCLLYTSPSPRDS